MTRTVSECECIYAYQREIHGMSSDFLQRCPLFKMVTSLKGKNLLSLEFFSLRDVPYGIGK